MTIKKGKVYLVGAGPGDPELITLKALKVLKKADVVIYDFLASPVLLNLTKKKAEKICVGKADGFYLLEQNSINRLLYDKAKKGKIVARLKGGDPFVFSRGIEEALYLSRGKIDFEIIPGITSAFAGAESFGIPLTRKGKFSSVAVLTGRKSNSKSLDAPLCDTLIFLMAVANIRNVIKAILRSGRSVNTPCAFIEKATTTKEKIISGNLTNIVKKAEEEQVKPPAVFIVGEIVKYGKKIYGHKYPKK